MARRTTYAIIALLGVWFLFPPSPASAFAMCMEAEFAAKRLEGMQSLGTGIDARGNAFSILESEGGEKWAIIYTLPSGKVCFLTQGTDWQPDTPEWGEPS